MSEEMYEKIDVEEEMKAENEGKSWTEEVTVAGSELMDMVKKLVHETAVRRIIIKNEAKRINFEFPLALGVAGIALLPVWAAVAMIAALVTDCKIVVERVKKQTATE